MKTKPFVVVCSLVLATVATAAQQQGQGQAQGQGTSTQRMSQPAGPPPTLIAEVQTMFNALKNNITRSAEQFPEDKYDWSPTPDVRTWGGLLSHIADDNNGSCFALAGDAQRPPSLDAGGKPTEAGKGLKKADINRLLAESFARCDKAFAAVTSENMMERQGSRSKVGALIYDTQHISEHYGNIVTYMRLQNMVPPSSAGRGRGGL